MRLLTEIPSGVVLALLTMLPRLDAEESITAANRVALGTGSMSDDDARSVSRLWSAATAPPEPLIVKPTPEALSALGIPVRRIPKGAS